MQHHINWETLYHSLCPKLMNYFRARLSSVQQAEDFVAMTFSRAWRYRQQYQPERGTPETWLFAIARNLLIDHFRRHEPVALPIDDMTIKTDDTIEQTIEQRETIDTLVALMSQLTTRESRILSLKYAHQLRTREIANLTGLSEANVTKIASRTVMKLRRFWEMSAIPVG